MEPIRIGVIGDYDGSNPTHRATDDSIGHASEATGLSCGFVWIPTESLEVDAAAALNAYDGLWCAPGSPYRSLNGAMNAIRFARENDRAFIATCGGFQHAVLEHARNVLEIPDAGHEEYDPYASDLFVSRLACSLKGKTMRVNIARGSRAFASYGKDITDERYYCDFGLAPEYRDRLDDGGMAVVGTDSDGQVRIVERPRHRYFIATLFVPQVDSRPDCPHPLVVGFLRAAYVNAAERTHAT